jgi:hypothetical protein
VAGVRLSVDPAAYRILLDPEYKFTQAYDLPWDAPPERA